MEFNEFLIKASEGYNLIPIIKEIESFDTEAIDIYSNHFDKKKSFFFDIYIIMLTIRSIPHWCTCRCSGNNIIL